MKNKFAVAINCIDGRVQIPVIEWIKTNHFVDFVDLITEPGPNEVLSENKPFEIVESIKKRVVLSKKKHDSKILAIVAHSDCASNRSSDEDQIVQLKSAVEVLGSWKLDLDVIGLWVDEDFIVRKYF